MGRQAFCREHGIFVDRHKSWSQDRCGMMDLRFVCVSTRSGAGSIRSVSSNGCTRSGGGSIRNKLGSGSSGSNGSIGVIVVMVVLGVVVVVMVV